MRIWNVSFFNEFTLFFCTVYFYRKNAFSVSPNWPFSTAGIFQWVKKGQSPRVASARGVQYQRPCFDWRKFTVFGNFSVNKKTLCRIDTLQFGKSSRFLRFLIVVSELGITCDFVLIFYDRKKNFEQLGMIRILINFLGIWIDSAKKGWLTSDF